MICQHDSCNECNFWRLFGSTNIMAMIDEQRLSDFSINRELVTYVVFEATFSINFDGSGSWI